MKKRLYSFTILFSLCILLICIFTKSSALLDIVNFSVNLFINNIFPSLFPMFVIGGILVEIDMERSENVRRWWPFLRDRRIDEYSGLTKRFLD